MPMTLMLHVAMAHKVLLPHQGCYCPLPLPSEFARARETACGLPSALAATLVQKLAQQHDPPKHDEQSFHSGFWMMKH